jgi:hypothetical protein
MSWVGASIFHKCSPYASHGRLLMLNDVRMLAKKYVLEGFLFKKIDWTTASKAII